MASVQQGMAEHAMGLAPVLGLPSREWSMQGNRVQPGAALSGDAHGSELSVWIEQRRALVSQLSAELEAGFQAVAAFDAMAYLDSIERQEEFCRQIGNLDRKLPARGQKSPELEAAAMELRQMNAELKRLADVQRALVEHGGRSIRCFQSVWAMGAFGYEPPRK